ncbi:putative transcriptional regulator [Helicobacter cinaedi PAGU611]|uniref:helix-turn-helix transcriptional regulator n=1 Tax=Helicobacter cinaedi TaxID=213 RepID=UPI00025D359D|nr:WYL domain-containing protein [Helicobacter cinaedi]BAM12509.1 putative transcriptional regulator [Helicobacter cinaedi PAGU611]
MVDKKGITTQYDTKIMRIVRIFQAFINGEHISMRELAKEFNVDLRTIQRDINQRLSFLPIQRDKEGKCYLQEESLGKLGFKDIREFARLSGIWGLYPSLDDRFLGDLLHIPLPTYWDNHTDQTPVLKSNAIIIKNQGFENISHHRLVFTQLSQAILKHKIAFFIYKDKKREVCPYRLLNNNGIWYLLADESGVLKHFAFSRIKSLNVKDTHFTPSQEIESMIEKSKVQWINSNPKSVKLQVQNIAKEYFMRKAFISNMRVEYEDSMYFYVVCNHSYDDEILNLVKIFLPFVKIVEPVELQEKLERILQEYLKDSQNIKS